MNETFRSDVALTLRGLASSRSRAQSLIKAGCVYLNGLQIDKCSLSVSDKDLLEVRGEACPYVSRGGFKLEKALKVFEFDPKGKIFLDVGASTGGFTDVLLRNGAKKVYALDVGTSQLAPTLREDPRVVVMEQTNARTMTPDLFVPLPDAAVMDVSFISIRLILPQLRKVLYPDSTLISLIKPQFEAGKNAVGKNGIVTDRKTHERVIRELIASAADAGWYARQLDHSPITGSDGNIEYLALFTGKPGPAFTDAFIKNMIDTAFGSAKQ